MGAFISPVTTDVDHRRRTGDNLLHLLGLPADSRVLIAGKLLEGWRETFKGSCFQAPLGGDRPCEGMYELALYHSECASSPRQFRAHLEQLRKQTATSGSLMIFAENFYSFNNLKLLRHGRVREVLGKVRSGHGGFRRTLGLAGLRHRQEFLPMPGLANAEEMVATDSHLLEVPHCSHPLLRLAQRCGRFQAVADGYVFLCAPHRLEEGPLLRAVAAKLARGGLAPRLCLERIDLRLRGAMVLFIREQGSGRHYIVRVASDPGTGEIICRNQEFLNGLRSLPGLPAELKSVIPSPLGDLKQGGAALFIETMLPGGLAWKVDKGRFRNRIYQESVNFLLELNLASRVRVRLEERALDRLFSDDLRRLENCSTVTLALLEEARKVVRRICRLLQHSSVYLAPAHGDYGYGNILVDPRSGCLTGVIDWDTGRQRELVGIDFLNLEIQKARIENNWGLFPAFAAVADSMVARGGLDPTGRYREDFGIEAELVPVLMAIALMRYMARAAQYPEVFASEQGDYKSSLDFAKLLLEANPNPKKSS